MISDISFNTKNFILEIPSAIGGSATDIIFYSTDFILEIPTRTYEFSSVFVN